MFGKLFAGCVLVLTLPAAALAQTPVTVASSTGPNASIRVSLTIIDPCSPEGIVRGACEAAAYEHVLETNSIRHLVDSPTGHQVLEVRF